MTRLAVPLRWGDLDAQGHINNAAFADYVQEARQDFLLSGPAASLVRSGLRVASQQIEYRAPAFFGPDPLAADLTLDAVAPDSFNLACVLSQAGLVVAEARTRLEPFDLALGRRRELEEAELEWLAAQREPAQPFRPVAFTPMTPNARAAEMRVRWSDIGPDGWVNPVLYFNYVMEGRIAFTAAAVRSINESVNEGYLWFVVRQDVDYLAPMVFRPEPYVVRTGVAHMGTTSLTFCSEIADPATGRRYAQASTVAVFADGKGRPIPVLQEWKDALEPFRLA
jgi:acyl-CoA thioester hydrolase